MTQLKQPQSGKSEKREVLTIVTPSFEKHLVQFSHMVDSLCRHCCDIEDVRLIVVVEAVNEAAFADLLARYPQLQSRVVLTEDVLADFGIRETPSAFLKRIGKFTFQTLKKFGGLRLAESDWSLVLDSEGLFHNDFKAHDLLEDYREQKYVFFTYTAPRGALWQSSTGYAVTKNCAAALNMRAGDRWYMEYFHWFYETSKVHHLLDSVLGLAFFERIANPRVPSADYFENILYYLYIEKYHSAEYDFVDFKGVLEENLPDWLSARYILSELPFSLFGNEYLLNILSPQDIPYLAPLFERYKLPFVRLEPPVFNTGYLPALKKLPNFVATISSHHAAWLRKKIAVCVSGEFRHIVHRTPEHFVRHLLGFISGVECDIYLHGWSNSSEPLLIDELKPRAYKFEPRPSFAALARRIQLVEPNIKPGRDEGSLAMFYGIEQAYRLAEENADEYDFILRIRPDIYSELSLKEILVKITDEGDILDDTIYFPMQFHSKGINDQIALGPTALMKVYATTFSYIEANIEKLFFNPETVLLRRLLESRMGLAGVHIPYALMREVPIRIDTVHERFHQQFHVWWSRTEDLPSYEDLSAFLADKLKAMDAMMRKTVPDLVYVRAPCNSLGGKAVIRAKVFDNDPSRPAVGLFKTFGYWRIGSFVLESGRIRKVDHSGGRHLFIFPENDQIIVSEWRMERGRLVNNRVVADAENASPNARALGVRIRVSLFMEARWHRRERARARQQARRDRMIRRLRKWTGLVRRA